MHEVYQSDFERFLAATDEKDVLFIEIAKDIIQAKPTNVLDIGAGNGLLSIPLAKKVKEYTAIEKNPLFVEKLRKEGLRVIEATFPVSVPHKYDFVLASHVLSYSDDSMDTFVHSAWSHVTNNGQFLIVTYRGEEDDWTRLTKNLDFDVTVRNTYGFSHLTNLLKKFGKLTTRKVQTTVKTKTKDEMIDALSFVASNGKIQRRKQFLRKKDRIGAILDKEYKHDQGYVFPFQHFFLNTQMHI